MLVRLTESAASYAKEAGIFCSLVGVEDAMGLPTRGGGSPVSTVDTQEFSDLSVHAMCQCCIYWARRSAGRHHGC